MRRVTETTLNRLLSQREGPTRDEQDAMLGSILDRVSPVTPKPLWGWPTWVWGLAGAASAFLLTVASVSVSTPVKDEFSPRGGAGPSVELACVRGGQPAACAVGTQLLFKVEGKGFVSAVARSGGHINWYLTSIPLPEGTGAQVLGEAVVLSTEHGVGAFDVSFVFADRALDRDAIKSALISPGADVRVVHRPLQVMP